MNKDRLDVGMALMGMVKTTLAFFMTVRLQFIADAIQVFEGVKSPWQIYRFGGTWQNIGDKKKETKKKQ